MILDMPSCVERCSATSLKGLMSSYEGERFSHLTSRGDFAALERFPRSRRSHPQRSGSLDSHRTEAGARGVGLLGAESRGLPVCGWRRPVAKWWSGRSGCAGSEGGFRLQLRREART